jgi:hypothetical protein
MSEEEALGFIEKSVKIYRGEIPPELVPPPPATQKEIDEAAVQRFSIALCDKLAQSREKGRDGWHDPDLCSREQLADMLIKHLPKGNPGNFLDIAALAMMLHERGADPVLLKGALSTNMPVLEPWRPIEQAPKGGVAIWAKLRSDISKIENRKDMEIWDGVELPLRHPGVYEDEGRIWDHGWNVAAPVGHGGFPDRWIEGWVPLRSDQENRLAWFQSDRSE